MRCQHEIEPRVSGPGPNLTPPLPQGTSGWLKWQVPTVWGHRGHSPLKLVDFPSLVPGSGQPHRMVLAVQDPEAQA